MPTEDIVVLLVSLKYLVNTRATENAAYDSSRRTPHGKNQPPAPPRLRRLTDLAEAERAFLTLEVYGFGREMER